MPVPVAIDLIRRTEEKLGVKFPTAYVEKVAAENGGSIVLNDEEWSLYPIFDDSDRQRLKRTSQDVVHETEEARGWPGFPDDAVAIGGNGSGDQLVFLVPRGGGLDEAPWRWDHETGEVTRVGEGWLR